MHTESHLKSVSILIIIMYSKTHQLYYTISIENFSDHPHEQSSNVRYKDS